MRNPIVQLQMAVGFRHCGVCSLGSVVKGSVVKSGLFDITECSLAETSRASESEGRDPSIPVAQSTSTSTIVDLARKITAAAEVIDGVTSENNFILSFDADSPDPSSLTGENAQTYQQARVAVLEAANEMNALLSGHSGVVFDLCTYVHVASTLRTILTFNLASSIPVTGSTPYDAIAKETDNLDKKTIQRLFAILTDHHIFSQPSPGHVSHTRLSKAMLTNPGLAAITKFSFEELYGFSYHLTEALKKWGSSEEPNETGFNAATGSASTLYAYIDENRDKASPSAFTAVLEQTGSYEFAATDGVVEAVDWEGLGEGVFVDVAGSVGHVSIELAKRYPHLQFIVQDYGSVIQRGEAALPAELQNRVRFEAKDMFEEQKVIPDKKVVYFLRAILHNWSDKYARRILQAIVPALKPGDRIVVNEQIVTDGMGSLLERMVRLNDMNMWAAFNGQERTAEQFEQLVRTVHPGLRIVRISSSTLGTGVIEIELHS
ncbi:uncharacterized protein APUU_20911A [Aspergillus puulaauensis]|uniref:O-methyltransferase C-terminal domain-containing protein n=1 Tax=Aspergillus puulaauensis TaxID=1220207 RepID=A0A7R7XFT1_9EURO|nr:uncharacterized protein APUU_20911A [Aspergillus puulaauensis]BCS20479.1 hypothetical protein APUU_20911A [Aspergillus puulaauensis]